jgi:tellurite resistance protein TerC
MNDILNSAVIHARRLIIIVVGVTILAAGLAMIVLPGPAVAVIPLGLAVLGT